MQDNIKNNISNNKINIGSIIFQELKDNNTFNDAINSSLNVPLNSSLNISTQSSKKLKHQQQQPVITHVGLLINEDYVIHSTPEQGVHLTPLASFLDQACTNIITQVNQPDNINNALKRALSCLGLAYNHSFYPYDDNNDDQDTLDHLGLYCSQLITYAFLDYFQLIPMNFRSSQTSEILPYWIKYYQKLNLAIPEGRLGSHPAQLLTQTSCLKVMR